MRRATIVGIAFCLSPMSYAVGCAQQEEGVPPPDVQRGGSSNKGGSGGTAGTGGSSGSTGGSSSGKGGSPSAGSGGSAGSSGGPTGGSPSEGGAGGAPQGAGGDNGSCNDHAECDDENECTDDACNLHICQHTANIDDCTDDGDVCTNDKCVDKACTHPSTGLCVCETDGQCDDENPCTDDSCNDEKTCDNVANTDPCPSDNNECTDDVCADKSCQHNPNTGPCGDDGTDCTDEACSGGSCQHTNNLTCDCVVPADCDAQEVDPTNCTFNRCTPEGNCDFVVNNSCDVGTEFVVNNFNSATDWGTTGTGVTSPAPGRPLTYTGFTNTNIEGGQNLYLADSDGATVTMDVASMAGLDRLAIIIQSNQAGTASMVEVGMFDGTWHDLTISDLGLAISQNTYATLEIPLLDYDIPLGTITAMRLVFSPTGGEKIWRIDHIEVRD